MGKAAPNIFFNKGFQGIIDNVDIMHACSAEPANYAAIAGVSLGSVALDSADFTEADGDTNGRKLTTGAQTIPGTGTGTANHIVLADSVNTTMYYVTTCTSVAMETAVNQDFSAWKIEVADPT